MAEQHIKHPAIRYHGGKFRLAPWIIEQMPDHVCYVEPFGGAAGVLLQKPRSYAEVYNDLDSEVVNLFRVLRDPELNQRLQEVCALTPYSRDEFRAAKEATDDLRLSGRAGWLFAPLWDSVPLPVLVVIPDSGMTANANTQPRHICGKDTQRHWRQYASVCRE